MRLGAEGGDVLDLSVVGYQFPDEDDPRKRYSWHMVQGRVGTPTETWDFRWQALTCDESPRLAGWLRKVAAASVHGRALPEQGPARIDFTEPNLVFEVESHLLRAVVIRAELDPMPCS
ncbi:MAG: WapI family immunity protein [Nakamurella sp.]